MLVNKRRDPHAHRAAPRCARRHTPSRTTDGPHLRETLIPQSPCELSWPWPLTFTPHLNAAIAVPQDRNRRLATNLPRKRIVVQPRPDDQSVIATIANRSVYRTSYHTIMHTTYQTTHISIMHTIYLSDRYTIYDTDYHTVRYTV